MKKLVAILIVLGLAGFASGANIIPLYDDFESYTPGALLGGPYNWTTGVAGPSGGPAGPVNIGGGGPIGTQATYNLGATHAGSSLAFDPISTGIVDINLNIHSIINRVVLLLGGDGYAGTDNYFLITFAIPNVYDYCPYWAKGRGLDDESFLGRNLNIPADDWSDVNFHMDFGANNLLVQWEDIDDDTGASMGTGWTTVYDGGLPFFAFDYFELGGKVPGEPASDNLRIIPEPVTLSILALGAGLALLRRRR